jgi:hypothetical protein
MATLLSDTVMNVWDNLVFTKDDNKLYHTLTGSDTEITTLASNLTLSGTIVMSNATVKLTGLDTASSTDSLTYLVRDLGGKLERISAADFCINSKTGGWHGSSTIMKVLPTDFIADGGSTLIEQTDGGNIGVKSSSISGKLYAVMAIPTGYKVTECHVYSAVSTSGAVDVYSFRTTDGIKGDVATGRDLNDDITFTSALTSSDTNAIVIRTNTNTNLVYGAKLTLERA